MGCCYLDVSYEELSGGLHRCFAVDDLLYGTRPVHGLVEVFGEESVAVFPSEHSQTPITYDTETRVTALMS